MPSRLPASAYAGLARKRSNHLPLELQCRALSLPEPLVEFRFHPTRRWRFDYAWPREGVALEVEGVIYTKGDHRLGGRHVSARGFKADLEKYGEAAAAGWRVIRVMPEHIANGRAAMWLERMFKREGVTP